MTQEEKRFLDMMRAFRKLNISSMLPKIPHGEFNILKMIDYCNRMQCGDEGEDGINVSSVVRNLRLPPPAVSRALRALEERGYIIRTINPKDRRNTYVQTTPEGDALIAEGDAIMEDFADAVFARMGKETMSRLTEDLARLVETAQAEIEQRKYREEERGNSNCDQDH